MAHFDQNPNLYTWEEPEVHLTEIRRQDRLLLGISVALTLFCGVIPTGVTRDSWVSFFGTAAMAALLAEGIGVVLFLRAEGLLDHKSFIRLHWSLNLGAALHAVLMAGAAVAGILCAIRIFPGFADVLVIAGFCTAAACSWRIHRTYHVLTIKEIKPKS